ncbi:hypothetical protein ABT158_50270 [Nonomuraea sp. NPDC001636]|uniref:hypothetical protein n=1 Tax=Nonomuraea sp. NPDC001636 TaxID=3154391 RepID=UPI00331D5E79
MSRNQGVGDRCSVAGEVHQRVMDALEFGLACPAAGLNGGCGTPGVGAAQDASNPSAD